MKSQLELDFNYPVAGEYDLYCPDHDFEFDVDDCCPQCADLSQREAEMMEQGRLDNLFGNPED